VAVIVSTLRGTTSRTIVCGPDARSVEETTIVPFNLMEPDVARFAPPGSPLTTLSEYFAPESSVTTKRSTLTVCEPVGLVKLRGPYTTFVSPGLGEPVAARRAVGGPPGGAGGAVAADPCSRTMAMATADNTIDAARARRSACMLCRT